MCCVQKSSLSTGVTHSHRRRRRSYRHHTVPHRRPKPDRRCYFVKGCCRTTRWRPPMRTSQDSGGGGRDRPRVGDELKEAVETTSTRAVGRSSGLRTTGLGSSFDGGSGSSFGGGGGGTTFGSDGGGGGGLGSSFLGGGGGGSSFSGSTFFGGGGGGMTSDSGDGSFGGDRGEGHWRRNRCRRRSARGGGAPIAGGLRRQRR
jgi:hypothetical protein